MVWGTGAARRHARTPEPDMPYPPPQTAECARCETAVVLAAGELPKGWVIVDGGAICADCDAATSRRPQPRLCEPTGLQPAPRAKEKAIGPAAPARYRGCRVGHEIALGHAAIQIRAGASPPGGRDEAVQFLLDENGMDQLIIELGVIRAELVASRA